MKILHFTESFESSSTALSLIALVNIQLRRHIEFRFKQSCAEQPQVRTSVWGTHGSLEGGWEKVGSYMTTKHNNMFKDESGDCVGASGL